MPITTSVAVAHTTMSPELSAMVSEILATIQYSQAVRLAVSEMMDEGEPHELDEGAMVALIRNLLGQLADQFME